MRERGCFERESFHFPVVRSCQMSHNVALMSLYSDVLVMLSYLSHVRLCSYKYAYNTYGPPQSFPHTLTEVRSPSALCYVSLYSYYIL
jgi:hypothetical protein